MGDRGRGRRLPRTNLDYDFAGATRTVDQFENSFNIVLLQPVDNEAIRGKQFQNTAIFYCLKRSDPGIELLLRQFSLEVADAAIP